MAITAGLEQSIVISRKEVGADHEAQEARLRKYLSALSEGDVDSDTAERAWSIWKRLASTRQGDMAVPGCDAGEERQVLLIWNNGEHHFDAEIFADGAVEFFYRNRRTGRTGSYDWQDDGGALPSEIDAFTQFV